MSAVSITPFQPITDEQAALLARLTDALDHDGLWWLSGYAAGVARGRTSSIAGLAAVSSDATATVSIETVIAPQLTIVYGSQTGNAKRHAEALSTQLEGAGFGVRLLRADAYPLRELKNERHLVVVVSTQGDGDPSDDARAFVEFIAGKRAPKLPDLHYAVLGLGDSSYPQFCAIGRQLDERLSELGATRWFARGDADLDIDTVATPWFITALAAAKDALKPQVPLATVTPLRPHAQQTASTYTRDNPFPAGILANQCITGRGNHRTPSSDKEIRHIELSLEGSGLKYEPGDALGVWPVNPPKLVAALLATLQLDGDAVITHDTQALPLREWLSTKREITRLSRPFLTQHAARANSAAFDAILAPDNAAALTDLLANRQLIDLLREFPATWTADELVATLRPLTPRLYSIASSAKAVGEEAHLTVAHVEYMVDDDPRWGTASNFLARSDEGTIPVFIEHNDRFRLPKDDSRDVILIGPGTGVAPFRAFVQERAKSGASGRNWLFFGNPHAHSDFLYQVEWQDALKSGALHRLDLAFSRDQDHKIYVQDRLRERGAELYDWLKSGASLYVCGDATRMAKDVHAALLDIIATHGGKSADAANDALNDLQTQGRYARDVY
ncbi:assimilatory sulfite reductase (NADPH) flavoprotein subunit [Solilutibacter silvestris]|uniref:Sulfite reductase [NADPH] flavoprotein alpha-component n=1 Tax=Solilutibacter silvestris TaxID=1645665 RepID=A0A2K1Q2X8_9GAMM|nr:assimilatory sulfite reductase (NADPH) flavoprotein subunit [Lysobacter silvestris]PNS09395.1 cysJ: sulfite reductase [NADPH] flavoprotein, alpha-component [Lysobacter silvestris]